MTRCPHGSHTGIRGGCPTHRVWQAKRLSYNLLLQARNPAVVGQALYEGPAQSDLRQLFEFSYETVKEFNYEALYFVSHHQHGLAVVCRRATCNPARLRKQQERGRGQADYRKISNSFAAARCSCVGTNLG